MTADTSKLDAHVEAQEKKEPDLFSRRLQAVSDQAFEMKKALEDHDLERLSCKGKYKNRELG